MFRTPATSPLAPRRDGAVSEMLGTILLTGVTIVLAGSFALVVFGSFSGASDTPSPTGAFSVDARPGLPHVNVSFREGTSFATTDARFLLAMNGTALPGGWIPNPLAPGRFSPGDVLRYNLTGPPVQHGARFSFFAVDADSGSVIGRAEATLPAGAGAPRFHASATTVGTATFSPSPLVADGASVTTIRVPVGASGGLALVRNVTANLTALQGGLVELRDDGTGGDAVASDGIYSAQFRVPPSVLPAGSAATSVSVPVSATDAFGRSVLSTRAELALTPSPSAIGSGLSADEVARMIANSSGSTNVLGTGGISRNLPSSARVSEIVITNYTWSNVRDLDKDLIIYRVTDIQNYTRTWVVSIYLDDCAEPYGAVMEVTMRRDGIPGSATWTPPSGCFALDGGSRLNLVDLNASINAFNASPTWSFTGDPTTFSYRAAGIGAVNQGLVPFFSDSRGGGTPEMGIGTAAVEWKFEPNRAPAAAMSVIVTGPRTVAASAVGSADPDGDALAYTWAWGDGTTSTGITATRTYASADARTITLYVNDSSTSTSRTFLVGESPSPSFTTRVAGLTVEANASASTGPLGESLAYAWNWGDGTNATGPLARRTYAANATDNVTLTLTTTFGATASLTRAVTHDGNNWPTCPPFVSAWGTVSACASLANATDAGAGANLTETLNGTRAQAYVLLNVSGFAEPGRAHTLSARAGLAAGTTEALALQVFDPTTGLWLTPPTFLWTGAMTTTTPYTMTDAQWNAGNPLLRLVDANCTSATTTCTGTDAALTSWRIDWIRVVSS